MKKFSTVFFVVIGLAGILLTYSLFPKLFPEWNITYKINREQAKEIAKKELSSTGFDYGNYSFISYFEINSNLLNYLNKRYASDSLKEYYSQYNTSNYSVNVLYKDDMHNVTINSKREVNSVSSSHISYLFLINSSGKILKFEKKYPDDFKMGFTDSSYALALCTKYLDEKYGDMNFKIYDSKIITTLNKNSLVYYAKGFDNLKNELVAQVEISNNEITSLNINYAFEQNSNYKLSSDNDSGYDIFSLITIIILFVILVVLMIRRIKNDEINFKFGIILGSAIGLIFTLSTVFSMINQGEIPGLYLIFPIIFIFLFMSGIFIVILSGTDSISRYYWNKKFYSFDAVSKKYFFVSKVRNSIGNGFIIASVLMFLTSVFHVIMKLFLQIDRQIFFPKDFNLSVNIFSSNLSVFYILFPIITLSIIFAFGGPLFITSLFKMKLKNNFFIISFSALVLAAIDLPVGVKPNEIYSHVIYGIIIGLVITLFFLKYDLLSIIFALFFEQLIFNIIKFNYFHIEGSEFNHYILLSILIMFIIIYFVSFFYKKDINYEELTPAIVRRITERERISKDLEAARHIQESFLPDKIPDVAGLDVGSVCLPAFEVGGDYYDYFKIDEKKLAIVIGDVSGKGIKAAFYMTLVKGIIKAQSLMYNSPAEMLSKANKIFFELVEKGNFISLIYGIFDLEKMCLTYANAGHNHIIIKEISKGSIRYDRSEGMALGLSEDSVFSQNIKEQVINFRPGDIFVFYTDGVVEAMNKERMEYGNDRFLEMINENSGNNSSAIVSIVVQRIKKFIGKAEQHDDLTLLIIKIK